MLVGFLALGFFALELGDGPFVDEYAYITQSYQPDLLLAGQTAAPAWLEGLTYDLVPLPKYLINGAYRAAGIRRPRPHDALAWYANTAYRWGSTRELVIARLPSILMGAAGCAAVFLIGLQARGLSTGWLAAVLLAINPLFRLHAHRAMSEAPCEALSLAALAVALWSWSTILFRPRGAVPGWIGMVAAGGFAGLAILAKFNGLLVLIVLAAWAALGLVAPRIAAARKAVLAAAFPTSVLVAAAIFLALNPFLTARPPDPLPPQARAIRELGPWRRFQLLLDHRRRVSRDQQEIFPHNALRSPADRVAVLAVQGFGRFGPLGPSRSDSTVRYDFAQDWGALLWLPVVLAGWVACARQGLREWRCGLPPVGWLIALWAGLAAAVVGAYLPMAWDRYQLPVQAPAAVVGAGVLVAAARGVWRRLASPESP